jgi:hypothetical protein
MAMADAELSQWLLRRLGAPMLKVELTQEHLEDAIEQAKRWFAAKKGQSKWAKLNISPGISAYDLSKLWPDANGVLGPDTTPPAVPPAPPNPPRAVEVDVVCDVVFPSSRFDMSLLAGSPYVMPDQQVPYNV